MVTNHTGCRRVLLLVRSRLKTPLWDYSTRSCSRGINIPYPPKSLWQEYHFQVIWRETLEAPHSQVLQTTNLGLPCMNCLLLCMHWLGSSTMKQQQAKSGSSLQEATWTATRLILKKVDPLRRLAPKPASKVLSSDRRTRTKNMDG